MTVERPIEDAALLNALATEGVDPRFADIDTLSVAELAELMNEVDGTVPLAVKAALPEIVPAIEAVAERMKSGGRLIYIGAGTPGRIGVLDASEAPPTFGTPPELVQAIIAGGPSAVVSAVEGAEDDAEAGAEAVDLAGIGPNDSVIGLASSGRTPFVIGAIERARVLGALTIGLSCNPDTALSACAEHGIEVLVGPELVSGSTRLKSGTAQKLVLNMFSTIAMVQLGKTYGNLMVDVRATNHKLRERALRIVESVTGVDRRSAAMGLDATGWEVKPAIVVIAAATDARTAERMLSDADGRLRTVLEGIA